MHESQLVSGQLAQHVFEQRLRIGIDDAVGRCDGRQAYARAVSANFIAYRRHHLQQQARAVLNRATVGIGALICTGFQKLVQQVAVGRVDFNAVKARFYRSACRTAVIGHDAGQLIQRQRTRR